MYAVERNHRASQDRAWLPPSLRRRARRTAGAVWAGTGLAIVGTVVALPMSLVFFKLFALGGAGAAVAGQQAGQRAFRAELGRLTRGEVPLAALESTTDGELVCVRGRIDATAPLAGLLHEAAGVYRRVHLHARPHWIFEAAVDFELVDERGGRITVQAGGARWLTAPREPFVYPVERFAALPEHAVLRERVMAAGSPRVLASERLLEVGAEVQIVGYKTVSAHVDGAVTDLRLPPQRTTLRSGAALPLVITRVTDLPR